MNDQTNKDNNLKPSHFKVYQDRNQVNNSDKPLLGLYSDQSTNDEKFNSNDHQIPNYLNEETKAVQNIKINAVQNPNPAINPTAIGITNSGDMEIPEGFTGADVIWVVVGQSTGNNKNSRIIRNNVDEIYTCISSGGCWGTVSLNSDLLAGPSELINRPADVWTYTLEAWGNNETLDPRINSTVVVTVVTDGGAPIFVNAPSNQTLEKGVSGNSIKWNATDRFPEGYTIYANSIQVDSGVSWDNSSFIIYNGLNGLEIGLTNITIQVFDKLGLYSTHTVFISMLDTISPLITSFPGSTTINEGTLGNLISWGAMDHNPTIYNISINGDFLKGNTGWDNSTIFSVILDGLEEGVYEIKLSVYDLGNNTNSHSVKVTVVGPVPTISEPIDFSFDEGSVGIVISWIAHDEHPATYIISSNSTIADHNGSRSWLDGVPIEMNLDGLVSGIYEFTITVNDVVGNFVSDQVIITVLDITKPQFELRTTENKFFKETSNKEIQWILTDDNPGTYSIYINEELSEGPNTWTNNQIIRYSLDNLEAGSYNITLVVTDSYGNQSTSSISLTIASKPVSHPFYRNSGLMIILLLLTIVLIVASRYGMAAYQKYSERKQRELLSLAEINGLLGIQMFLIVLPGGVPVYQERFKNPGMDPTLLGGFTSALSTFMTQLVKSSQDQIETKIDEKAIPRNFEVIEKHGLSIISHQAPNSTILVVTKNKLPEILYDQIYNLHLKIIVEFGQFLDKTSSILTDEVLHPIFEWVGLKIKLIDKLEIDMQELDKLITHTAFRDKVKLSLQLLKEFYEINTTEIDQFEIRDLMTYYLEKGYSVSKAADFLIFASTLKVII